MNDLAVDDRQHGAHFTDVSFRHREVVAVKDHEVCKLAGLNRSDPVFHAQEPAGASRKHSQRFLACELLIAVDAIAKRIHSRHREMNVRPGIEWCDVNAVAMHTNLDTVVNDGLERRTDYSLRII